MCNTTKIKLVIFGLLFHNVFHNLKMDNKLIANLLLASCYNKS